MSAEALIEMIWQLRQRSGVLEILRLSVGKYNLPNMGLHIILTKSFVQK